MGQGRKAGNDEQTRAGGKIGHWSVMHDLNGEGAGEEREEMRRVRNE